MAPIGPFLRWTTQAGAPITIHDTTITPLAQALTIRWSGGGFVWNRPVALLVNRNGQREQISILDVTRLVQLILFTSAVLLGLILLLGSTKEKTP
ncbi:MAG: hypothetical protein U0350_14455 [Caldilineaceae bacterium]